MAIIWIEEVEGPRLQLENILARQHKMDVAHQLAGIRRSDSLQLELSTRELAAELIAELSDANVNSMLGAYGMVNTWKAVNVAPAAICGAVCPTAGRIPRHDYHHCELSIGHQGHHVFSCLTGL
jgi:hypothetical protein